MAFRTSGQSSDSRGDRYAQSQSPATEPLQLRQVKYYSPQYQLHGVDFDLCLSRARLTDSFLASPNARTDPPLPHLFPSHFTPLPESTHAHYSTSLPTTFYTTTMAVTNQVLTTAELLESVLLHVRPRTLLLSQRVCKDWQLAITRSKPLQRALFLQPIRDGAAK